jgi:type VI secretion system secreted protein VgrG
MGGATRSSRRVAQCDPSDGGLALLAGITEHRARDPGGAMDYVNLTFKVQGLSDVLRVATFRGVEDLSSLYRYELSLFTEEAEVSFADVLGRPAVLTMVITQNGVESAPRHIHGIIADFEQDAEGKRVTVYHATLVPEVWKLDEKQDHRIFQELAVPDIIAKVIDAAGLAVSGVRMSLQESYDPREYCVQYRESDWAFIMRLMEEEGIYCFFEHASDKHTLVLVDAPAAHEPIAGESTLVFRPSTGALAFSEHVATFRYREAIRPGKVTLRDYNFKKPLLDLTSADAAAEDTTIEVYHYPGHYDEPTKGSNLAKVRLEHWQAQRKTAWGDSGCARLLPGRVFTLSDHPRGEHNRDWLITRIELEGGQAVMGEDTGKPFDLRTRFHVMPSDVPFRPALRTPKPRIYGAQTAIVVGPAGEEIYPDEHGRVKVHFHWDRLGKRDDKDSCWIRVSQVWAGAGWGAMQIPRIGQEVVVEFLEGDPDRPLIVGRVYHATNVPPYKLPAEKTKSTLRSDSTKGGGGSNELMFEDGKGREEIYLHAEKDWTIAVENDKRQTVGHDERLEVGHDRSKEVAHDQEEKIGNNKSIAVGGSHTEMIAKTETVTVGLGSTHTIGGAFAENIGAAKTTTVGTSLTTIVGARMNVTVGGPMEQSIGAGFKEGITKDMELGVGGKYQISVAKEMSTSVGESQSTEVAKVQSSNVGEKYSLVVGDGKLTILKNGDITLEGKEIHITGSGPIYVKGSKLQVESDGTVDVKASGTVKVKGSGVEIN